MTINYYVVNILQKCMQFRMLRCELAQHDRWSSGDRCSDLLFDQATVFPSDPWILVADKGLAVDRKQLVPGCSHLIVVSMVDIAGAKGR